MGFTGKQIVEIKNNTENAQKSLYIDLINSLNKALAEMHMPDIVDPKYEELYAEIKSLKDSIKNIISEGVSDDPTVNYKNEALIGKFFNLGSSYIPEGENAAEAEAMTSLQTIMDHFDRIMKDGSDQIENNYLQNASILIGRLSNAKLNFNFKRLFFEATQKKIKVNIVKQNLYNYEKMVEEHIKHVRHHFGHAYMFTEPKKAVEEAKARVELIEVSLAKEEALIETVTEHDERIDALLKENEAYITALGEANKENTNLGLMEVKVDEILISARAKADALDRLESEIAKYRETIRTDEETLKNLKEAVTAAVSTVQGMQTYESTIFTDRKYTSNEIMAINEGLDIHGVLDKNNAIVDLLSNDTINTLAKEWLKDYNGKDFKDFAKHLDEKSAVLCAPSNPDAANNDRARQMLSQLVFDVVLPPLSVKDIFLKDNVQEYINDNKNQASKCVGRLNELAKNTEAANKNFHLGATIEAIKDTRKKIAREQNKATKLLESVNKLEEKLAKEKQVYADLKNKAQDNTLKEWLKNSLANLHDIANLEAISGKIPAEFADRLKELGADIEAKNYKKAIAEYKNRIEGLTGLCDDITKATAEKKSEVGKVIEENETKITNNNKEVDKIKKELTDAQLKRVAEIKEAKANGFVILERAEDAANKQSLYARNHVNAKKEAEKYGDIADSMVNDLNAGAISLALNSMLDKYRHLNDARKWRFDSDEYKAMVKPLCDTLGLPIPGYSDDVTNAVINKNAAVFDRNKIVLAAKQIKKNAEEYLEAKGGEKLFNTRQRYQRITMARELIDLSDSIVKNLSDTIEVLVDCKKTREEFKEVAKELPAINTGARMDEAYGLYLHDKSFDRKLDESYLVEEKKPALEAKEDEAVKLQK